MNIKSLYYYTISIQFKKKAYIYIFLYMSLLEFILFLIVVYMFCRCSSMRVGPRIYGGGGSMGLAEPHRTDVRNGEKTWEGRLNKGKHAAFKIGDIIDINNEFKIKVVEKAQYKTFESFINDKGLKNVLPTEHKKGSSTRQAVDNVYRKFYPKRKEKKHGVLGIRMELI